MSSAAGSSDPPDIPDQGWENPFAEGTFLHDLYGKRVRESRDLIIILDDFFGGRGTGKTVGSLQLANGMDQSGGLTYQKCSLQPQQLRNAYIDQPKRSGLVLDEGEFGISNRDAVTKVNKALRKIMSMGRVKEKYVVVNTPLKGFLDKDILKLADVWISMVRKGLAVVHELRWEPYSEQLLTPHQQWFEFEDIPAGTDLRSVYNKLADEKDDAMDDDLANWIPQEEHEEELQRARQQARQETRNELIRNLWQNPDVQETDLQQQMIAESAGLTPARVSQIIQEGEA